MAERKANRANIRKAHRGIAAGRAVTGICGYWYMKDAAQGLFMADAERLNEEVPALLEGAYRLILDCGSGGERTS